MLEEYINLKSDVRLSIKRLNCSFEFSQNYDAESNGLRRFEKTENFPLFYSFVFFHTSLIIS